MKVSFVHKFQKFLLFSALLLTTAASVSACGKGEEPVDTKLGVDGYVYLPEKILTCGFIDNIKQYGDSLYYHDDRFIQKVDLRSAEDETDLKRTLDFSDKTSFSIPETEYYQNISAYPADSPHPIYDALREQILGSGEEFYSFLLKDFAVDTEGNLYYYMEARAGENVTDDNVGTLVMDAIAGMLYRQTPEGEISWELSLASVKDLAIDHDSNIYALSEDDIIVINGQGQQTGKIDLAEYHSRAQEPLAEQLQEDIQGHVYYTILYPDLTQTVAEISSSTPPRLQEISGLLTEGGSDIFPAQDGNLLISDYNEGIVYLYEKESACKAPLLRWEDVDLLAGQFHQLFALSPDSILAVGSADGETELYLLNKTPVSELPEKELIVLASLSPTDELRQAVVYFNQSSSKYHVTIETYASSYAEGSARLDATLVSSTPPDILDLDDIYKYTSRGLLEDLTPYLENSSKVPLDDFLDNVLEGYTIDGKLVSIPTAFSIFLAAGRASQLDALAVSKGWTMEDAYALTDRHPNSLLLHTGCNLGPEEKKNILNRFCSTYYLEKFVDWEAGTCSFDSEEFRRMLLWVDEHAGEQASLPVGPSGFRIVEKVYIPENALLVMSGFNDFKRNLVELEYQYQEEIRLLGIPTKDGRLQGLLYPHDTLSLVSNARNKEGAWAFLEYFLSRKTGSVSNYFSTRKSVLKEMYEEAITPPEQSENGEYLTRGIQSYYGGIDNEAPEVYLFTPQRLAESLLTAIETSDFSPLPDNAQKIREIVTEELESYYNGDKNLEEATRIIQNRAQLLLRESMLHVQ